MTKDTQFLQWHGQQYRVRVKVPAAVRGILGKSQLVHPLHTPNIKKANELKWSIVARFKATIANAERALLTDDPLEAEALRYRVIAKIDERQPSRRDDIGNVETVRLESIDPDDILHDEVADEILHRAYDIEQRQGEAKAKAFYKLATGATTPLMHHFQAFTEHKAYPKKSRDVLDRGLRWLRDWLVTLHLPAQVESVTPDRAGRFMSEVLYFGRSRKTMALHVSFLREFWKWMVGRQYVSSNPWTQSLPEATRVRREADEDEGKRPFADSEVLALLGGDAGLDLDDVMRISALSGLRLEEICQLRVKDCADGLFKVRDGKTSNAKRTFPIHSTLTPIIERRTSDRPPSAFLIHEVAEPPKSRESRSDPLSKRFTRYRRKCGVDERPNTKMKSNVDFHSFRRWFIRKARDAMLLPGSGFDMWSIVAIVGHTEKGKPPAEMTMRHYAGADPSEMTRRCIEAVRLPIPESGNASTIIC
jgi:integrase